MYELLKPEVVAAAHGRIKDHVHRTPVLESSLLNHWLGHRILFKAEGFQKIGAFKIRGAVNALLTLKEQGSMPDHIVTYSSGNHAQGVALAARMFGVKATVFMTSAASAIKAQATRGYGAEVIITRTRPEAEAAAHALVAEGAVLIPPFDSDDVIAGQGTACFEAIQDAGRPDAIFAPCGGGGLLSGTYLAAKLLAPQAQVWGAEPRAANDAVQSLKAGRVIALKETPVTVADGAAPLSVAERTFRYLQKLHGITEIEEEAMLYWSQWLTHLLKTPVEPTSAASMQAAAEWLARQKEKKTVLIILTGGNISPATYRQIWQEDRLGTIPALRLP